MVVVSRTYFILNKLIANQLYRHCFQCLYFACHKMVEHTNGPVPQGMPSSLVNLTLHSNKLIGVIPSDLPLSLEHLDLSDNTINGSIPTVLPTGLLSLLLNKNKLSGSLPSSIPSGLVSLDVSNNNLSGPVPDLSSIEYIYLNRDVPHTIGSFMQLSHRR
eukprot:NODE_22_length_38364_cov_0.248661.p19 type:complete len:160 gc:universal NODE_22_length_38364_cov_0.248661:892-413(-)